MDDLARQGFDVYLVDLIGYGRSDRPAAMESAGVEGFGSDRRRTDLAVADVGLGWSTRSWPRPAIAS